MNRKKRIKNILNNIYNSLIIDIIDNSQEHSGHNNFDGNQETHFKIIIDKNIIKEESRLNVHQNINNLLKHEFASGLHSLEIKIV